MEVQNGNIAGLVVDQAVGESLIATSNGGLEVSNFAFTSEEASFGKAVVAAKGSEDLLAEVNTVINQVVNDGSYLRLMTRLWSWQPAWVCKINTDSD